MANDTFEFKKFSLKQDRCAMKVGTDAVLIGSWVDVSGSDRILDIGTGTGIIALMIAQRTPAQITALEIDKNSFEQACENAANSTFKNQITVINQSFQDYWKQCTTKFNLIVTNPPYFVDSLKSNDSYRSIARHADVLPFSDLVEGVVNCLAPAGKFCVILPKKEALLFRTITEQKGLHLSKLFRVKSNQSKEEEIRQIMQFEFKPSGFSEETISIRDEKTNEYSAAYKALTKEYHLNF